MPDKKRKIRLFAPETVNVAVSINRFDFIAVTEEETGFGFISGMKIFYLKASLCLNGDPFDVVFGYHRMLDTADLNVNFTVIYIENRNVLLRICFS